MCIYVDVCRQRFLHSLGLVAQSFGISFMLLQCHYVSDHHSMIFKKLFFGH